ncbi:Predicted metal-dependent enzyme of the double-stranded beta helix superfamily [Achromobacter xylosoxidans]|uniref:cysteine dioxygenase family protein n=1 Tax=Alcaligenes xylosoxydans xylosoxydans TaxID=85698 RepID=UPI0006C148CF|nr:cysteine dioxygenase [Achromobacter xylosoxidans]MCH1986981.1 cysteine dioxygenase [Achromobacter xylosoxidans]MCH4584586.1 cysteine dioxygenase [Achromobacter xylosoxidans]CUJ37832.1 Predicted metal-dependent enzyme of the double-stranded beta helix superfamily [Achromobacter xylosoxidans]CUJ81099.1 Predicted metal-dependent enzyme of the double-stranded beta helix superfamily [Achromobacter xylosoxidans]
MPDALAGLDRLRHFIVTATRLATPAGLAQSPELQAAFAALIAHDDWLPEACTAPHPQYYQQYLLHCDPLERFSLVSFVWGPGQQTPVHDHEVWGYVGMLRGAEVNQRYARDADGRMAPQGAPQTLRPGDVECLSPQAGDIHRVSNAFDDKVSISVHMYGGNIGAVSRHVYDPATGQAKPFVSGYSAASVPNLWDRSAAVRAALPAGPA